MKKISWWNINLGESEVINKVNKCIKNKSYSMGVFTEKLENELSRITGFRYIVLTNSGSSALLMASITAGVSKEDIVCIPNRTWIATAHAPSILGAKISLVDTEKDRPIFDTQKLKFLKNDFKAVYPVSLNGNYANIGEIRKIIPKTIIIEDCAQAFLSYFNQKHIGLESDMACFSLGMAKILPVGQGGFIGTNNIHYARKLKFIRSHGVDSVDARTPFMMQGFNFRPTDLIASVGLAQIDKLEERRNSFIILWRKYRDFLSKYKTIKLTPVNLSRGELPLYIEVISKHRDSIVKALSDYGVGTRKVYPDLDTAKYLNLIGNIDIENSRIFGQQAFVLPSGPDVAERDLDYIFSKLKFILDSIEN